jgi:predicted DNA-binding ribbon-helix-helix protein
MNNLKSGGEIVKEFFNSLLNIAKLGEDDKAIAQLVKNLYEEGKLTETNFKNLLDQIIEQEVKE